MTTHHDIVEYWDGGRLKVFRGFVTMKFDDPSEGGLKPAMTHFFCMDEVINRGYAPGMAPWVRSSSNRRVVGAGRLSDTGDLLPVT